jgi:hypothetical protein
VNLHTHPSEVVQAKTELFFHNLPHDERHRLLGDLDLEIEPLTRSDASRLPLILARFSLTIFVPLILSLLVLFLSQHLAPLPTFGGSSAADSDRVMKPPSEERAAPYEREWKYDDAESGSKTSEQQLHEQQILIARRKFQLWLLLLAFSLVTLVFLVGQQFLSNAQSDLTMLWCEISEKNEPVAENHP